MYHPLAMDHIRIDQDLLRRRTERAARWAEPKAQAAGTRRGWRSRPRRSAFRLAMATVGLGDRRDPCVDC